jgi:hypothetical protein
VVSARLGEPDEAFRQLEIAPETRNQHIHAVGFFPDLIPLRGDPRFPDLLRRLDLPDARLTLPEAARE